MPEVQFKISSALKTIIGKELITDDFIAVFELVKNSFDAQAHRVDITFERLRSRSGRIIIMDDGDGMDEDDIRNKWLFVAYSVKKLAKDYRDKIASSRIFAGAKGIGRFSCDRLGKTLRLYTKKKGEKGPWHVLDVDWSDFEQDPQKEFASIPARYSTSGTIHYSVRHGTVLEIAGLRSPDWGREKLLLLRRSLERLVNPNQENDAANFEIFLEAPDEVTNDSAVKKEAKEKGEKLEQWQLVNGPVRNFVFETLGLKTAQIRVRVDPKGEVINTRLEDRGTLVYELEEKNPFEGSLRDINIHLFALNRSAKMAFTKRMGVGALHYGSVFLYKNGFRIHPFGDPNDDNLGIDRRHQQGVYRTLGTRDLSGRVEINGSNPDFQETSSRDGGLISTQAFTDLKELIINYALKRLEKFVIDLAQFGTEKGELPDPETFSKSEVKEQIFDIVAKLTQSKEVVSIKYDPSFLNILENKSAESVSALLGGLKRLASEHGSSEITREVTKAERQLKRIAKAKEEAEASEARERERAKKAEEEAKRADAKTKEAEEKARKAAAEAQEAEYKRRQLNTQNIFLKSILSKDLEHVITLHHSIGQDALTIEQYVSNVLTLLKDPTTKPEDLRVSLERISYVAKKIATISRIATQANHRAAQEELTGDLIEYIREYLLNIYKGTIVDPHRNIIPIRYDQPKDSTFATTFAPINIGIIFDNLISNTRKHKVRNIDVKVLEVTPATLRISFGDDGSGIPKRNLPHIFEIGFSTTDGSGLGLHHIKEIMTEMGGTVDVVADRKQGAEFILTFTRRKGR